MKRTIGTALICLLGLMSALSAAGQTSGQGWTLRQCIDYARENNIQVQSSQVSLQSARVDLQQAKADRTPTLGFTTSQNVIHQKKENENSGNYALNAGLTLYNGGKLKHSLRQQQIVNRSKEYEVEVARNDIEIAVTQAYLEILYANETVKTNAQTVESSAAQMERSKALLEAGSIARSDYAQMEAQYSSDCYQLTVSENDLAQARLQLKQLLELGIDSTFDVVFPEIDSSTVLAEVPRLEEVYRTALEVMPQMESGRLNIQSALAGERVAKADGLPTVTASAAIGTGNTSGTNYSFYNQLNNKLNESAGITVSVLQQPPSPHVPRQGETRDPSGRVELCRCGKEPADDRRVALSRCRLGSESLPDRDGQSPLGGPELFAHTRAIRSRHEKHCRIADREEQLSGGPAGANTGQVSGRPVDPPARLLSQRTHRIVIKKHAYRHEKRNENRNRPSARSRRGRRRLPAIAERLEAQNGIQQRDRASGNARSQRDRHRYDRADHPGRGRYAGIGHHRPHLRRLQLDR